jgi:copper transport protein
MCCTAVVCALTLPFLASAHASPVSYTPEAGATELATPSSVSVSLTERIEPGASSLTVYDQNGNEVQEGKGTLEGADGRTLTVPIRDAGQGVYSVSWQVVSVDDGHFTKGAFSFLVDATGKKFEGDAGGVQISYSSKLPEGIIDFVVLIGESVFLAVLLTLLAAAYARRRGGGLPLWETPEVSAMLIHAVAIATVLYLGATALVFFSKSAELADLQKASLVATLPVYLRSTVGTMLALKALAGLAFLGVFLIAMKKNVRRLLPAWAAFILALLLLAILYMQSQLSHAAASYFHPKLSIFVTFIHLAGKEFIIGGACLMAAAWFLAQRRGFLQRFVFPYAAFNALAAGMLFLATVSGAYISWLHLKHFSNIADTEWGARFIILLCASGCLGVFRLFHQVIATPRIASSLRVRSALSITLPVEAALGLLVLFFSGYISITTPPFLVEQYTFAQTAISQGVAVTLDAHPYEKDSFRLTFKDAQNAQPADIAEVYVSATNRDKHIGPNEILLEQRFAGGYAFPKKDLLPAGTWDVHVAAVQRSGYDITADFTFRYPDDVAATKISDDVRHFDAFTKIMIALGAAASVASALILAHAVYALSRQMRITLPELPREPYRPWYAAASIALIAAMFLAVYLADALINGSSFKSECLRDGNAWHQAFPTRYFEAVSPNALNGCFVHEGHFHFVDQREYEYFKETEQ